MKLAGNNSVGLPAAQQQQPPALWNNPRRHAWLNDNSSSFFQFEIFQFNSWNFASASNRSR
jgi:hypothetical protein